MAKLSFKNLPLKTQKAISKKYGVSDPPKASRFLNKVVVCDGMRFDSRTECDRRFILKHLERAGQVRNLARQVRFEFPLQGKAGRNLYYKADHVYEEKNGDKWQRVIEDVKSPRTAVQKDFRLKYAMMKKYHDIEIRIIINGRIQS